MTYREKLELYSQGKLDKQQTIEIERDLEKQEALSDYLFEHQAPPGMEDLFEDIPKATGSADDKASGSVDDTDMMTRQINRSIQKAFIKTGAIATIIALILTLFIVFALPHIVSAFYYDPAKDIGVDSNGLKVEQMERDMSVYAELTLPELGPELTVGTDSYGYGNYSYYIDSTFQVELSDLTTIDKVFTGNLKRNSFACYNYAELKQFDEIDYFSNAFDDITESLNQMNADDLYYTYVTLDRDVPYEAFYADFVDSDEYGTNASWVWCGVKVSGEEDESFHFKEGFFAATRLNRADYDYDEADYPMLAWEDSDKPMELDTEEKAKTHFFSMIKYLSDTDFMDLSNHLEPYICGSETEYIGENGMNVYGFLYVSDKEHVENVANAQGVRQVAVAMAE